VPWGLRCADYTTTKPYPDDCQYYLLRPLPAFFGSLTPIVTYGVAKELGAGTQLHRGCTLRLCVYPSPHYHPPPTHPPHHRCRSRG
jgi:hypothetical protein